ncbi:F0F1 ATP synthase subunit A [Candidatus Uabimicrobium amorphum]|uniref:ATP synthase subunit a n=1 Tax=Uabimicrobium amorphum TaxID=2596890 RepID=A0A5S9F4I4_UABAM|nr:F0F1 ATP synthase subunit A [Candidatus Uabimicrobium amorphum]BBM85835.1 ATP synthase subunit a [Candidatus Uabimicrobium amorphum]
MHSLSSDKVEIFRWHYFVINQTILFTWVVMAVMTLGAWLITRKMKKKDHTRRWQHFFEVIILGVQKQIEEMVENSRLYVPFIATLFLFIASANFLTIIPGYRAPTASLSTTVALAIIVFVAVPIYGIRQQGFISYLKQYVKPSFFMLPFNIIGELSRTLALAVRLFGNMMSGEKIIAILLSIAPLFLPVVMQALGLLTGFIQAYIFAILAMVYIASATRSHQTHIKGENT